MSKIAGSDEEIEFLVNCKTYPVISKKYFETVCTGGVRADGKFVRLYPVPFRYLDAEEQYSRWDIIKVKAYRDSKDQRPESWHLNGPIEIVRKVTGDHERWDWMKATVHSCLRDMDAKGLTNGCVQIEPLELGWSPDKEEWSEKQQNLINQGNLLFQGDKAPKKLERIPYQFRLKYRQKTTGEEGEGKVLAWSYYAGFVMRKKELGDDKKALDAVIHKINSSIFNPLRTVFGIFGTHSRSGNWMISSIYHLPSDIVAQGRMTFE